MGWTLTAEVSPAKFKSAVDELERRAGVELERKAERDQAADAIKALRAIGPGRVSGRERVLITAAGHDDPDGEGFNGRYLTITLSRIDPDAGELNPEEVEAAKAAEAAAALEETEPDEEADDAQPTVETITEPEPFPTGSGPGRAPAKDRA